MSFWQSNGRSVLVATMVGEVMTQECFVVAPDETIAQAAVLMREKDVGSLAVGLNDKLVGMLTDRDIAVRATAQNRGPETPIREIMSDAVKYCFDDEDVEQVAQNMADLQVRRLPVVNREKRLVGVISLSNIAESGNPEHGTTVLKGVATPHW
ncbi:MAG: CBS domain-containing protein [Rhodanobacteraceae bacterium]